MLKSKKVTQNSQYFKKPGTCFPFQFLNLKANFLFLKQELPAGRFVKTRK